MGGCLRWLTGYGPHVTSCVTHAQHLRGGNHPRAPKVVFVAAQRAVCRFERAGRRPGWAKQIKVSHREPCACGEVASARPVRPASVVVGHLPIPASPDTARQRCGTPGRFGYCSLYCAKGYNPLVLRLVSC